MYYKKKIYIKQRFVIQDFIWKLIEISSGNFFFFFFAIGNNVYFNFYETHFIQLFTLRS